MPATISAARRAHASVRTHMHIKQHMYVYTGDGLERKTSLGEAREARLRRGQARLLSPRVERILQAAARRVPVRVHTCMRACLRACASSRLPLGAHARRHARMSAGRAFNLGARALSRAAEARRGGSRRLRHTHACTHACTCRCGMCPPCRCGMCWSAADPQPSPSPTALPLARTMERDDVGVVERGERRCLPPELRDDVERHVAVGPQHLEERARARARARTRAGMGLS